VKNIGIGLSLGLIGGILWYASKILIPLSQIGDGEPWLWGEILKYGSFSLMVAGPLTFWVILPILEWRKRRKGG